jgi:hypothetical protein
VPIRGWQDYLSLKNVHTVAQVNNKIYAAADVGLFYYDTEEYVLKKITKTNGLSYLEISAIAAIPNSNKLFIGYENGNIDILEEDQVKSIPYLKIKDMNNSKRINHVNFIDNKAYCSTDFGILVVDYINEEIPEYFIIGDNASNLKVYQTALSNDSIYAATESGIKGAPVNNEALVFYETWETVSPDNLIYKSITAFNNDIFAAKSIGSTHEVVHYQNGQWIKLFDKSNFINLSVVDNHLAITTKQSILLYNNSFVQSQAISTYNIEDENITPYFSSVIYDGNNFYTGDTSLGLVKIDDSGDIQILPDGPYSNTVEKLIASPTSLWVVSGNNHLVDPQFKPAELSIQRNKKWKHLTKNSSTTLSNTYNFCDIVLDPFDDNHGYIASARSGIFEIKNDTVFAHYTKDNSTIQPFGSWELITSLSMDKEGNLFACNQAASMPIIAKEKNQSENMWFKYDYLYFETNVYRLPWLRNMIYTNNNQFWAVSKFTAPGIFIFDTNNTIDNSTDDSYRSSINSSSDIRHNYIALWDEYGQQIEATPICIAEDKSGYIWVGTSAGVMVYYQPKAIFDTPKPTISRIKIAREDGSNLADYLFENDKITSIAVDEANRKWIGTDLNGIFLVSADGSKTLQSFNTENSPLISNTIKSISINPKTGEVFIGTSEGIVS